MTYTVDLLFVLLVTLTTATTIGQLAAHGWFPPGEPDPDPDQEQQ